MKIKEQSESARKTYVVLPTGSLLKNYFIIIIITSITSVEFFSQHDKNKTNARRL